MAQFIGLIGTMKKKKKINLHTYRLERGIWLQVGAIYNLNNLIMDIYTKTELKKRFNKGNEIEINIIQYDKFIIGYLFNKKTHQLDDMYDLIEGYEMGGYEVWI